MWVQKELAPEFEKLTGIKVEMELLGRDDVLRKALLDAEKKAGVYDLYYIDELEVIATFMEKNAIVDIYEFIDTHQDFFYPDYDLPDLIPVSHFTYNGKLAGLPFETFLRLYTYRRDLFEDPSEKKAFSSKYGWELRPPKTWDEYEQIAEFFTRPPDLYGHIAMPSSATIVPDFEILLMTYGIPSCGFTLARRASFSEDGSLDSPAVIAFFKKYIELSS